MLRSVKSRLNPLSIVSSLQLLLTGRVLRRYAYESEVAKKVKTGNLNFCVNLCQALHTRPKRRIYLFLPSLRPFTRDPFLTSSSPLKYVAYRFSFSHHPSAVSLCTRLTPLKHVLLQLEIIITLRSQFPTVCQN